MTAPASHFEITDLLHGSCKECHELAESAAIHASATGSTGGSFEKVRGLSDPLAPDEVQHSAKVRRIPEARVIVLHDPQTLALDEIRALLADRNGGMATDLRAILRSYDLIKEA